MIRIAAVLILVTPGLIGCGRSDGPGTYRLFPDLEIRTDHDSPDLGEPRVPDRGHLRRPRIRLPFGEESPPEKSSEELSSGGTDWRPLIACQMGYACTESAGRDDGPRSAESGSEGFVARPEHPES